MLQCFDAWRSPSVFRVDRQFRLPVTATSPLRDETPRFPTGFRQIPDQNPIPGGDAVDGAPSPARE